MFTVPKLGNIPLVPQNTLVLQEMDCYASIVWLIMKGDHFTKEFLTALTASQVSILCCCLYCYFHVGV